MMKINIDFLKDSNLTDFNGKGMVCGLDGCGVDNSNKSQEEQPKKKH
ncbi:hypothetical protein [Streptococcus equinus]|uniref:Uncharacterized protein n=1 Tax=Streptococcus equinus TaxID=1335 RepID=A0A1G9K456_STREI|nr:hypothetical protein [Streptococcus equinus]SDL44194.1 hypothetical protein SAMN05216400_0662 [Streptococcus equinus]